MWRKVGSIIGVILAVAVIVAYICIASHLAQQHRSQQSVAEVLVSMSDSTATQRFASSEQIRSRLQASRFKLENMPIDSVDAVAIAAFVAQSSFVRQADVYVTYSGKVYVDIKQHQPVLRLLSGGYNSYVTAEGEIFNSPKGSAYYTSVVTGTYKPLFGRNFEGNVAIYRAERESEENEKLLKLAEELSMKKSELRQCKSRIEELKKSRRKTILERIFKDDEGYRQRQVGVKADIAECEKELAEISKHIALLGDKRLVVERRKQKLYRKCDDFCNLVNFVSRVNRDSFWSAEVVQFDVDTTLMGEISLRLIPRSGNFVVEFGTLDKSEEKLNKLLNFYEKGLSYLGWDRYKTVDIRYDKQVICTE